MQAYSTTKYPVFEADQVLTQKHLNNIVSFLEEQDRLTRTGLIGIGVYCGLDISYNATKTEVTISCGKAVTSLGFEITWEEKTFSLYHNIELSSNFLNPDFKIETYLEPLLGDSIISPYRDIKNTIELLEADTSEKDGLTIPANFFDNKIIVILLETSLINQKNCIAGNCDDKGKRIEFNLRPLVVDFDTANKLNALFPEYPAVKEFQKLLLPRYNVPYNNLATGTQVLNAFKNLLDVKSGIVADISGGVSKIYNYYKAIVDNDAKLTGLNDIEKNLQADVIDKNINSLNVQYLWDWLHDITSAYNEIVAFGMLHPALCCVRDTMFPFHVVLGNPLFENNLRTPFIKTGNTDEEKKNIKKLTILFERLMNIISSWSVTVNKTKITPSRYGNIPLSQKAIPYYYTDILDLNKTWDPDATLRGRNNEILSYYSDTTNYTTVKSVKDPLSYDLEPYSFFRIEGHIGKDYNTVLTEISSFIDTYNLPFDVVALNAVDPTGKTVDISKHGGDWGDLELDYDLARKRVYKITEDVIGWMESNKDEIMKKYPFLTPQIFASLNNILEQVKELLTEDLNEFLPGYADVYEIFKNLHSMFSMHRQCIIFINSGDEKTMAPILEDLIDHMDEIDKLFLEDPFTVIYEEAQKRWEAYYKDLFLSTYLQKNKGFEHAAGVTRGGTFILVYSDNSIFKKQVATGKRNILLETIKEYNKSVTLDEKTKEEITKISEARFNKKKFTRELPYDEDALNTCKNETENIKENVKKLVSYNVSRFPPHLQIFLKDNINILLQYEPVADNNDGIPQKTVFADFFVPYICCGGGNSLKIVPDKPPVPGDFFSPDFLTGDFKTQK